MPNFVIRQVSVQAFRAFKDSQSTPLLPMNGLVGVRGFVKETGGSSGAGKSSVGYAIAYALGFLPFSANKQQNWLTDVPMQVELILDTDRGPAILRRGKENSLTIGGKCITGSVSVVEAAIREMTGLPTDLLKALTYRQQQRRSQFLTMTDAEKKEFLSMLLGVQEIEQQISEYIKLGNKLAGEAETINQVVTALSGSLAPPAPPMTADLKGLILHNGWLEEEADKFRSEFNRTKPQYTPPDGTIAQLESALASCDARLKKLETQERYDRAALNTAVQSAANDLRIAKEYVNELKRQEARAEQLLNNLGALNDEQCPTCKQDWEQSGDYQESVRSELDTVLAAIKALEQTIATIPDLQSTLETNQKKLADYTLDTLSEMRTAKADLQGRIVAEKAAIKNHRALFDAELVKLEKPVLELEARRDAASQELNSTRKNNEIMLAYHSKQAEKYYEDAKVVQAKKQEYLEKLRKANEELDYAAALKAYLGGLFEEILLQVSAEANELLRKIPNTSTTSITFTNEVKGSKQEIKPVVIKCGKPVDLESGTSGGQLESIELAVDLSLAKVIGQRKGVRPGFMIFDESFSAHCMPVKEACLQILQQAANDCLILVIDHATELKEYFSTFIDVESSHDISRIVETA